MIPHIDRYEIVDLIGQGGMGSVYRARHLLLERDVALKVLKLQIGDDQEDRLLRFNQEGRLIAALHHPNIVAATDLGVDQNGNVFLAMEYVPGRSLADELESQGKMPWKRALPIFIQVADALAYAHGQGIIHRDIKPSNIMLTTDDQGRELVKILDFGVAKFLKGAAKESSPVTRTGIVFGSPPYMSPEQCAGARADGRSDVYSLGCVMYETLTGRTPITGENSMEILHKQVFAIPPAFDELSPAIKLPAGLESIIWRSLEKEVEDRYQSMDDLRDDLARLQDDKNYRPAVPASPPAAVRAEKLEEASNRPFVAAAIVVLLVISVVALVSPRSPLHHEYRHRPAQQQAASTTDEATMREAILGLTKSLYKDGKGREAEQVLKQVIKDGERQLPADDAALKDIKSIESVLEQKNLRTR